MGRSASRRTNCGSGARRDHPRSLDSTRHQDRAPRRRRRIDWGAVLSHGRGVDAVRGRARPCAPDAARTRDPLARCAAGEPAHARSAVHGRPRGWLAGSDRHEPDAAGTRLCHQSAGALDCRWTAADCRYSRAGAVAQSRYALNRGGRADTACRHPGADLYRHDRCGARGDPASRRIVAGGAGAAAVDPGTDFWRRRLAGRDLGAIVRRAVFDAVRAVAGQFRGRTVCRSRQPAARARLIKRNCNLEPIACEANRDYQDAMTLIDLANPSKFLSLTARVLPWLAAATAIVLAIGLYQSATAPDDYQQGATVKIMFIHVPNAWLSMFVWGVMSVASLGTLVWRHPLADVAAKAAAPIGAAFTFLALLTGSLWGRPMWGTYWEWDARLTSVLILFLMYLGLMALWRAVEDPSRAARAAAVLTLVGAINLPIIKFSVDWWNTLHQPASVMRMGGSTLDRAFLIPLLVMAVAFTLLFVTLHLAAMRNEILRRRVRSLQMMQASRIAFSSELGAGARGDNGSKEVGAV